MGYDSVNEFLNNLSHGNLADFECPLEKRKRKWYKFWKPKYYIYGYCLIKDSWLDHGIIYLNNDPIYIPKGITLFIKGPKRQVAIHNKLIVDGYVVRDLRP